MARTRRAKAVRLDSTREQVVELKNKKQNKAANKIKAGIKRQVKSVDSYPAFAGTVTVRRNPKAPRPVVRGVRDLYDYGDLYNSVKVKKEKKKVTVVVDVPYANRLNIQTGFIDRAISKTDLSNL